MAAPECVWPSAATLGEAPFWSAAESALWFVDIKGRRILRFESDSGRTTAWSAPSELGFVLPRSGGGLVCGLKTGLTRFDPNTGTFSLCDPVQPRHPDSRLNDGHVDKQGRLWFNTIEGEEHWFSIADEKRPPTGALYCVTSEGVELRHAPYIIANGPAISPDGRTLYHVDTFADTIYAFEMHADGGLSAPRDFAFVKRGHPDGIAVDRGGHVWVGLFDGWGLNRYAPDGRLVEFIEMPCANVTKAAFGGPDLRTLYITTSRDGLNAVQCQAQPLAGGLFAMAVDTAGLAQNEIGYGF